MGGDWRGLVPSQARGKQVRPRRCNWGGVGCCRSMLTLPSWQVGNSPPHNGHSGAALVLSMPSRRGRGRRCVWYLLLLLLSSSSSSLCCYCCRRCRRRRRVGEADGSMSGWEWAGGDDSGSSLTHSGDPGQREREMESRAGQVRGTVQGGRGAEEKRAETRATGVGKG